MDLKAHRCTFRYPECQDCRTIADHKIPFPRCQLPVSVPSGSCTISLSSSSFFRIYSIAWNAVGLCSIKEKSLCTVASLIFLDLLYLTCIFCHMFLSVSQCAPAFSTASPDHVTRVFFLRRYPLFTCTDFCKQPRIRPVLSTGCL